METYEKHIYEVDVIQSYFDIQSSFIELGKEDNPYVLKYLDQLKGQIDSLLDKRGLDNSLVWSHKLPIVILPNIDIEIYTNWLALFLYGVNQNKVHLILEYHFQHWNISESFLNRVEFFCLERLNESDLLVNTTNGNNISLWLHRKREILGYDGVEIPPLLDSSSKIKLRTKEEQSAIDSKRSLLTKKLFFSPQKNQKFFNVLQKCLLLENEETINILQAILDNSKVERPIEIKLTTYKFVDIFRRLKEAEVIFNQFDTEVAKWIHENFLFYDMKKETYKKSTEKTILKVLRGERTPPAIDEVDLSSIL